MRVEEVAGVRFGIGEGALWDAEEQALYAVDVMARQIVRYDPASGETARFDVPHVIGSIALRRDGGAIVGLGDGVYRVDLAGGAATPVADPAAHDRALLLTEGKADPAGRFLVSSFSTTMQDPVGALFSIDRDGTVSTLREGVIVPNGLAWSPDGTTMYFADSGRMTVFAYDYDVATGAIANERVFADTTALGGVPDGATTDSDGNYWVAICKAGLVACYSAAGVLLQRIAFPTQWVASVAFGGADGGDLYVTSLDPGAMNLGDDPEGGKLFVVRGTGAKASGADRYAG